MSTNFDDLLKIQNQASEETADEETAKFPAEVSESSAKSKSMFQLALTRLLLVLAIVAIPVGGCLAFFGSALNLKTSLEKNSSEVTVIQVEQSNSAKKQVQEDNLRGIVAIGQQSEAIKGIEERKVKPEIKVELEEPKLEVKAKKVVSPQPTPVVVRHSSPPVVVSRPQPRPVSQPVAKISKSIQYDSMSDWQNLASLGSYGGGTLGSTFNRSKISNSVGNSNSTSIRERMLRNKSSKSLVVNAVDNPSLPPIVAINASSQQELTEAEALFLEALQSADEPQPAFSTKTSSSVAIAQQVKAKLNTGINYAKGMPTQRSFIRLEEALLDVNDRVKIPAGSLIVYEVYGVNGGIIDGQALAILTDDREYPLPKNAISVLGKNGDFLMAKSKDVRNGGGNSSVLDFTLGAAQQTNDLINRPNSSFSSSTQFGSSSSVNYGNRNYAGAILSGGLEKVLEGQTQELARRSNSSPVSSFWQLKQGSTVMLQVNFAFDL